MLAAAAALVSLVAASAVSANSAALPKLTGTVGPGFTITLKKGTKKVTTLKAGKYRIVVADKSDDHDFHLKGPGVNRVITGVDFVGTKTVTLTLKKGKYTYVCRPHLTTMKGGFTVR